MLGIMLQFLQWGGEILIAGIWAPSFKEDWWFLLN